VKRKGDYSFLWFVATATLVLIATILFTILVAAFEFKIGVVIPDPFISTQGGCELIRRTMTATQA
jgi:hypothetical protein